MVATTSEKLTPFLAAHEGFVSKAYRCPAGVLTIGYGMTMRSKVFAAYWQRQKGRSLKPGDRITRGEADEVLTKMLAAEYSPPVARVAPRAPQHAFDAASSVSYNCGPGSLKWKWAQALGRGDLRTSAKLLRNTAVTANGRRLAGLVRRRAEEADLLEYGRYGRYMAKQPPSVSAKRDDVKQYQGWLKTLGHYNGEIDGDPGPLTIGAVKNFQKKHDLVVDGIVGPATRATMIRAMDARKAAQTAAGGGAVGGATGGAVGGSEAPVGPVAPDTVLPDVSVISDAVWSALGFGIVAIGIIIIAFLIFRNRRRLFGGRRVPT